MGTALRVSLEEYLNTDYRPDVEYLDGELREKPVVQFAHSEIQGLLSAWFWQHRKEWHIKSGPEARTKVSAQHVRLPDMVVVSSATKERGALTIPPLVAIEVRSPDDTHKDLKDRAADLEQMGVENVWLIDEKARTAKIWRDGDWQLEKSARVQAVNSPIYLDLDWLWQQLDEEN